MFGSDCEAMPLCSEEGGSLEDYDAFASHRIREVSIIDRSTGSLQILLHLSDNESCSKYSLRKELSLSQDAIENSLSILTKFDLITCTEDRNFPFAKRMKLSEKGMKLVEASLTDWPNILRIKLE